MNMFKNELYVKLHIRVHIPFRSLYWRKCINRNNIEIVESISVNKPSSTITVY